MGFLSCTSRRKVDYKNYDILTSAKEISDFYNIPLDTSGTKEQTEIITYFGNSCELSYSYDFLETEEFQPLFYSIKIEIERTTRDASKNFFLSKAALKTTNSVIGLSLNEVDTISLPGDQNYYAVRIKNNEPNGIFLIIRKNKRVYTLVMSGIYSTDNSLLTDLILPKIEKLETAIIE